MSGEVDLVKLSFGGGLQDWLNRGVGGVAPSTNPGVDLSPGAPESKVAPPGVVSAEGALVMTVAVQRPN